MSGDIFLHADQQNVTCGPLASCGLLFDKHLLARPRYRRVYSIKLIFRQADYEEVNCSSSSLMHLKRVQHVLHLCPLCGNWFESLQVSEVSRYVNLVARVLNINALSFVLVACDPSAHK
jgi:hypothetical protein